MKIAVDSCSIILLAKAGVLEEFADECKLFITEDVYKEVLDGKDKKFADALLAERLVKEKKIDIIKNLNKKLVKKLMQDFNLGIGEAGTLSIGINKECEIVATDNKQGRKACIVNRLKLIGSIDIIVALHKLKRINKNNAISGLNRLREFGWFHNYLIDNALEDIKNV